MKKRILFIVIVLLALASVAGAGLLTWKDKAAKTAVSILGVPTVLGKTLENKKAEGSEVFLQERNSGLWVTHTKWGN